MNNSFEEICSLCDTTMDKVVNDIFHNCDIGNTGQVKVSSLISYIEPFLNENIAALLDLKQSLDPDEKDPSVSLNTVFNVMSQWSSRMKEIEHEQVNVTLNDAKIDPVAYSTPMKPVSLASLFDEQDLSISVHEELCGLPSSTTMNELLYQYRRMKEEAQLLRTVQNVQEETIDRLQTEAKDYKREILALKSTIRNLEKEKEEYEDLTGALNEQKMKEKQLNRSLEKKQKELDDMQKFNENLEKERNTLSNKFDKLMLEHMDDLKIIAELEAIVNVKETEIVSMQNRITLLEEERDQQTEYVRHIVENNEKLKTQKVTYEKCLWKALNKTTTPSVRGNRTSLPLMSTSSSVRPCRKSLASDEILEFRPNFANERFKFYNYDQPYVRMDRKQQAIRDDLLKECRAFNSPRLLEIISAPPLSPFDDDNIVDAEGKSTIESGIAIDDGQWDIERGPLGGRSSERRVSLFSVNADIQMSFDEDDFQRQVDYINLDHSAYDCLESEMKKATQSEHERILIEYEQKLKALIEENSALKKSQLDNTKMIEDDVDVDNSESNEKSDFQFDVNRKLNKSKWKRKCNINPNKLEIRNDRLMEKLDAMAEKLTREEAHSSEYLRSIEELKRKFSENELRRTDDETERRRQMLELFCKLTLKKRESMLVPVMAVTTIKPLESRMSVNFYNGVKKLFGLAALFFGLVMLINFVIVILDPNASTFLLPMRPNEYYGFVVQVKRHPGPIPI